MNAHASAIIDALKGTAVTARLAEVSDAAVSQWRVNGIPKPQLNYLRLANPGVFKQFSEDEIAAARSDAEKSDTSH